LRSQQGAIEAVLAGHRDLRICDVRRLRRLGRRRRERRYSLIVMPGGMLVAM
jgi:hypothetical protein